MSKLEESLRKSQAEMLVLADAMYSLANHIRVVTIFVDEKSKSNTSEPTSVKSGHDDIQAEEYPLLDEAIKCIAPRYNDREQMAKLVIANRNAPAKKILKLCQEVGWISPNTSIDNVRFIPKILDLYKKENVSCQQN